MNKINSILLIIGISLGLLFVFVLCLIKFRNEKFKTNNNKFDWFKNAHGIIQIGAHLGEEAQQHSKKVGKNMIWIEAQSDLIERLRKNVKPYKHKVINATLWNKSGIKKEFNVTNNSVSSSLLKPYKHILNYGDPVKIKKVIPVTTITWKDLSNIHPELLSPIYDFLLLDCQGAEYEVLQGIGPELIQQFKEIEVEISNSEEYKNQKQQKDITKLLDLWGYKCLKNCDNKKIHGTALYGIKLRDY